MRKRKIERLANKIHEETDLFAAPVDVVKIAHFYGFSIYTWDDAKNAICVDVVPFGTLDSNRVIVLNSQLSLRFRRYIIAQLLGLWFLSGCPECRFAKTIGPGENDRNINNARLFASYLLAPKSELKRIRRHFSRRGLFKPSIPELADCFSVPSEAVARVV